MISIIIPCYRNPKYLDFCLKSIIENQVEKNEIIAVIDGFVDEYKNTIDKYKNNVYFLLQESNCELPTSINNGVYNASNEKILILNEDNVVGREWDKCLNNVVMEFDGCQFVYTVNQVEPDRSIYNFIIKDLGRNIETFDYQSWLNFEQTIKTHRATQQGNTWPAFFNKTRFMIVNGFDPMYGSGYLADWDFFLKLEMSGCQMNRIYETNIYHFVSKSIKGPGIEYKASEKETFAREIFKYKWGYNATCRVGTHSHKPDSKKVNGVTF